MVHVASEDALAYARWLGHDLPTEAEWEFATRGGLGGAIYTWGDSNDPADKWRANTWQGRFPRRDDAADGYSSTAPVGCFPPNGYGLLDMAGTVWEYTRDWFVPGHPSQPTTNSTGPMLELLSASLGRAGRRSSSRVGRGFARQTSACGTDQRPDNRTSSVSAATTSVSERSGVSRRPEQIPPTTMMSIRPEKYLKLLNYFVRDRRAGNVVELNEPM